MLGLRVVHVTSMPGQNGFPTQLPMLARVRRTCSGASGAEPVLNLPPAHCFKKKYWVSVSAVNLSTFVLSTELLPAFNGISGMPIAENRAL